MANKFKVTNKFWVVDRLNEVKEGKPTVSYHLLRTLEASGYIKPVHIKVTEGPGRGKKFHELTGKGRGYLGLAKSWKRPEDKKTA